MNDIFLNVDPDYSVIQGNDSILNNCEMSKSEIGFLCGLLKMYCPKKVLEVGVASGGTTAVVLKMLESIEDAGEMFSVDLNENLYFDQTKETGYIARDYLRNDKCKVDHRFLLGKYLPEVLPDIEKDIDFVILDTVHHLPGELLDFLAVLPFLSDGAIVVLHDVSLEHNNSSSDRYCFSNQILFDCASGAKYLNNDSVYPNIAAFKIKNDTFKNIIDVFSALTLTWEYLPDKREIGIYRNFYSLYYPESLINLFDQALELNRKSLHELSYSSRNYIDSLMNSLLLQYEHILLYGAGKRGNAFYKVLVESNKQCADKVEFLLSKKSNNNLHIAWEELDYNINETMIVLTANSNELRDKLCKSRWHWIDVPDYIWNEIERVYGEI